MINMKLKKENIIRLFGFFLLMFLFTKIDLKKSLNILKNAKIEYFITSVFLFFPVMILKTYRLDFLLKIENVHLSIKNLFAICMIGQFTGTFTPGRLGDFAKIFYLKNEYPFFRTFLVVLIDRLMDLLFLFIVSFLGLVFFSKIFGYQIEMLVLIILILVFLVLAVVIYKERVISIFKKILRIIVPGRYKSKLDIDLNIYKEKSKLISPFILTTISYLFIFLQCYILAKSIDVNVSFLYFSAFVAFYSLVSLVPITIAGIGTREATLMFLFSHFSLDQELAIAYSILFLVLTFTVSIFGFITWIIKPLPIKKEVMGND